MGNMWFQAGIYGFRQVLNREQDGEYMVSGRSGTGIDGQLGF